jgi:anti-anti-sigma regulatory factor
VRAEPAYPDLPTERGEFVVVATRINGCVVVTAPKNFGGGRFEAFEQKTLNALQRQSATAVIFELSGVHYLDVAEFYNLKKLSTAIRHLGARSIFVGLRPGIINHLLKHDADVSGIEGALGLDDALARCAG